jgi:hypothetical protein
MATKLKVTGVVGAEVLDPKGQHLAYDDATPDATAPLTLEEALPSVTAEAQRSLKVKLDAITTTIDRSAVDQAFADATVADEWFTQAEAQWTQAVELYQAVLGQPFTTVEAFKFATEPLAQRAAEAQDFFTFAQGRVQALQAKAKSLKADYMANVKAKQDELVMTDLGVVTTKATELQQWFTDKCMHALKVTRGATAQPGPDVLSEYETKFAELSAQRWALGAAIGSTVSAPTLDTPLTPEKIARSAWYSGETQNNPNYRQ